MGRRPPPLPSFGSAVEKRRKREGGAGVGGIVPLFLPVLSASAGLFPSREEEQKKEVLTPDPCAWGKEGENEATRYR